MKHLPMPKLTDKQIDHFWSKVNIKEPDECWEWVACLNRGHGLIGFQYKSYLTHRIAYFLHNKKDLKELLVCHSCDNRKCCNPNHLWLGTIADDMHDMIAKGRDNKAKGSKHYRAKLTGAQIRQIRKQYVKGVSQTKLGKQYGVGQPTIQRIVHKQSWKHI